MQTEEKNWGAEPERQPVPLEDDTVLYSECGRIVNGTDCRSHSFKLVKDRFRGYFLLVRHGGGDERIHLGYPYRRIERIFSLLDSDARYWLMFTLMDLVHDAARSARDETAMKYKQAFVDGKLKKRRLPKQGVVKVWIE